MLSSEEWGIWNELVEQCRTGSTRRVNIGSEKRTRVILAIDSLLRKMGINYALIEETLPELATKAGWVDLRTIVKKQIRRGETEVEMLRRWARNNGYVKLATDQTLPHNDWVYEDMIKGWNIAQREMLTAGWRRVEIND